MAIERTRISHSQLAELLGSTPDRFIGVQMECRRDYAGWVVITEGPDMQTTGTMPQAHGNTNYGKGKGKGGKKR